jgi:ribonuclease PH
MRTDGRMHDELRPLSIERNYTCYAAGSVLVKLGRTHVLCTAMVEDRVPRHCLNAKTGWVTAEYTMLPSANDSRRSMQGPPNGRTQEIQRLIGRSLRAAVDITAFPRRTIWLDCNVIQADGGTRTASVTGAFVALVDALSTMKVAGSIAQLPILQGIAAVSVGVVDNEVLLDLCVEEDRGAAVDMNVVMSHDGRFVEVQGTAEKSPYDRAQTDAMLDLAVGGIEQIKAAQIAALGDRYPF